MVRPLVCVLAAASVVGALSVAGCHHTTAPPAVTVTYRPLTTPIAPLADLALCYARHDSLAVAEYATLFDAARYVCDCTHSYPPSSMDYDAEVASARCLFLDPSVRRIAFSFLGNASDTLNLPASETVGDPPGTVHATITQIALTVTTSATGGSEEHSTTGTCEFWIAPTDTVGGAAQWRIVRWRDGTGVALPAPSLGAGDPTPVPPTSWCDIKNLCL